MTPSDLRASGQVPPGYELLPIEVIELLIDAAWRSYVPAFGGNETAVANAYNAAQAAQNVIDRYSTRVSAEPVPAASTPHKNGCHNKPRAAADQPVEVQDGWDVVYSGYRPMRVPRMAVAPFRMSTTCQYDKSASDPGCAGCMHGANP